MTEELTEQEKLWLGPARNMGDKKTEKTEKKEKIEKSSKKSKKKA